jgi:Domain of unknown function (DUF4326)
MTAPARIRLSRAKGWRLPPDTVVVARPTRWGNPFNLRDSAHCWTALAHGFKANVKGRTAASVAMFHAWILKGEAVEVDCGLTATGKGETVRVADSPVITAPAPPSLQEIRQHLRGKNLACWCALDAPCHADVLLELANRPEPEATP